MIDSVSEWETRPILNESLKEPALKSHLFANWTLVVLYFCQHMLNLQEKLYIIFVRCIYSAANYFHAIRFQYIFDSQLIFLLWSLFKTIEPFNQTINQIN